MPGTNSLNDMPCSLEKLGHSDWSGGFNKGRSFVTYKNDPQALANWIQHVDLSHLAFKGQEHGMVQQAINKKVGWVFSRSSTISVDTGKMKPEGQPWSQWTPNSGRLDSTHPDWEKNDPFYGHGNNAGLQMLASIVAGQVNVSNMTEEELRSDLNLRFKLHFEAQRDKFQAYMPYIRDLQKIDTKEGLEAFDQRIQQENMAPETGMSHPWEVASYATDAASYRAEAQRRISLIGRYIPYTRKQLKVSLAVFRGAPLDDGTESSMDILDKERGKYSSQADYTKNPYIIFSHGEINAGGFGKALESELAWMEQSSKHVDWDINTLQSVGSLMGLLETIRRDNEWKSQTDLLSSFPDYEKRLLEIKEAIETRQKK